MRSKQKGGQHLSERVDELVYRLLGAGTHRQHGQNFGAKIDGQPDPEHLGGAAQSGAQFV